MKQGMVGVGQEGKIWEAQKVKEQGEKTKGWNGKAMRLGKGNRWLLTMWLLGLPLR